MRGASPAEVAERVQEALALVDLADAANRPVTALSGGEQQRVALARAIAPAPRVLLLDEPLGSLDRVLRDRLLEELPRVFAALAITVVYVTHDQQEALALADRVALMQAGRIVQQGRPEDVWRAPATPFVARFLGLRLVEATVRGGVATTPLGAVARRPPRRCRRRWRCCPGPWCSRRTATTRARSVARSWARASPATAWWSPLRWTASARSRSAHRWTPAPETGSTIAIRIDPARVAPLRAPSSGA